MGSLVGRKRELRALRARLAASNVTLLAGRAGIGKTTLARAVVADRPPAIEVGVRPGDDLRQTLVFLHRALDDGDGPPPSFGDLWATRTSVIGAAEHARATFFLDDLQHLPDDEAEALVAALVEETSTSRWLIAARRFPAGLQARLSDRVFELGDLDRASLRAIAHAVAPLTSADEVRTLVGAAQGSPWLLRRCLQQPAGAIDPAEVVAALPRRATPLLHLLAALHLPIDARTAEAFSGRALPRGPEVERRQGRVRAHDALRDALALDELPPDTARRLSTTALRVGDPAAALEAARMLLVQGDFVGAGATLDAAFEGIVEAGLSPRLHRLVRGLVAPELAAVRLRVAIVLGAGAPLDEALADPRTVDDDTRLLHAEALRIGGRPTDGLAVLDGVTASEARSLLRVRLLTMLGRLADAEVAFAELAAFSAAAPESPRAVAELARLRAATGAMTEATRLADALGTRLDELSPAVRREIQQTRLVIYLGAGLLPRARAVARTLRAAGTGGSHLEEQTAVATLALAAVAEGDVSACRRHLAALDARAATVPSLRFLRRMSLLLAAFLEGDFASAVRESDAIALEARVSGRHGHERWGLVGQRMRQWLAKDWHGAPDALDAGDDTQGAFLRAFARMRAARLGGAVPAPHALPVPPAPDAAILTRLADATILTVRGELPAAREELAVALALAEGHGYRANGLEARLLAFDTAFLAGDRPAAREHARTLARIAETHRLPRFAVEAELEALVLADRPDVATLERIAADARAPSAALRARALLGTRPPLDAIDAAVVAEVPWYGEVVSADTRVDPSFGVDLARRHLWFPDRRTRACSPRALHGALLHALVDAGGACTKEHLARAVWGVQDYHPLRDDKRIHVAIMRLRRALEDPSRVVSTDDGYALAGEPARVVLAPAPAQRSTV